MEGEGKARSEKENKLLEAYKQLPKEKYIITLNQNASQGSKNDPSLIEKAKRMLADRVAEDEGQKTYKRPENLEARTVKRAKVDKLPFSTDDKDVHYDDPDVAARTCFVGNIPADVDYQTMGDIFLPYGEILSIRIVFAKGFGFVRYKEVSSCTKAIESVNGYEIQNRYLKVRQSRPRNQPGPAFQNQNVTISPAQKPTPGISQYNMNHTLFTPLSFVKSSEPAAPATQPESNAEQERDVVTYHEEI